MNERMNATNLLITQVETLSNVVGRMQQGETVEISEDELADLGNLSGNLNKQNPHNGPTPPPTGRVYQANELTPDDWVYYVQTPAVEWRVANSVEKSQRINSYQAGGTNYGYFLDNFQRVRDTYDGKLAKE